MRKVVKLGMRDAHIYQNRRGKDELRKGKTQPNIDKSIKLIYFYIKIIWY